MLRFLFNLFRWRRAGEKRDELRRDLRTTYEAERAKADYGGQDFRLMRDLERAKQEEKERS